MVFAARFVSLIGAVLTFSCLFGIFVMFMGQDILPTDILDRMGWVFVGLFLGGFLLIVGQMAGNDLFTLRGKDSLFRLKPSRGDSGPGFGTGGGFDGGGDCGGGD